MRFNFSVSATSVFALCGAPCALAQHLDVMPVSVIGDPSRIETGAFDFGTFSVAGLPPQRAYENDLVEPAPGADLLVGEAGFSAPGATAAAALLGGTGYANLPGGVNLRFDFRSFNACGSTQAANLWYWGGLDDDHDGDYSDDLDFHPASGAALTFERSAGLLSATVDGGPLAVPGFVIGTTATDDAGTADDETGFLHVDLDALLDDTDSDPGTAVPTGIYAVSLTLSHSGSTAEPIFWVFNAGLGEDGEGAAEAALACIPEPSSLACVAMLASLGVFRRNRRS